MEEKDRIRELRKRLGLTLEKFGERLGVSRAAVSNIENGARGVTEQMRLAICREYGVSEKWLRTGEGDMFVHSDAVALDEYARQKGATPQEYKMLKAYFSIPKDVRKDFIGEFEKYLAETAAGPQQNAADISGAQQSAAPASSTQRDGAEELGNPDTDIEAKVEAYRQRLLEESTTRERLSGTGSGKKMA